MIENAATAAALFAEFLKTRKENEGAATAEDFRVWMERTAFPRLLAQSDQLLQSLISLKASETERFQTILSRIDELASLLSAPSAIQRWRELRETDRLLLHKLLDANWSEPFEDLDSRDLDAQVDVALSELYRAAKYLDAEGLAELHEYIGGWKLSATPTGVLLTWSMRAPEEYAAAEARIRRSLPDTDDSDRIGALAKTADLPLGLCYAFVQSWADRGWLKLDDAASPFEASLVYDIAEPFRRMYALD